MFRLRTIFVSITLLSCLKGLPAAAQAEPSHFSQTTGEELYRTICQGCHMPEGRGAVGAGGAGYPALRNNANLESSGYPLTIVVNGQKAMPPFGRYLTDTQVASVVNYVRTHFGNHFDDTVKPEDVAAVRPQAAK